MITSRMITSIFTQRHIQNSILIAMLVTKIAKRDNLRLAWDSLCTEAAKRREEDNDLSNSSVMVDFSVTVRSLRPDTACLSRCFPVD